MVSIKKCLYRHTKKCTQNTEIDINKRQTSKTDGQSTLLLATLLPHNELLKTQLFPRLRADDISLVVKKDHLICHYAYSYMKGRRSKDNLDLVRQNVRWLTKLLKYGRTKDQTIY